MPRLVDIHRDEWSEPLFLFLPVSEAEISGHKFGFGEQAFKIAIRESVEEGDNAHADWPHANSGHFKKGPLPIPFLRVPNSVSYLFVANFDWCHSRASDHLLSTFATFQSCRARLEFRTRIKICKLRNRA